MSCTNCFEDWICKCIPYDSEIVINTTIPAGTYVVVVTDHHGNKWQAEAVRAADTLTFNVNDFPDGLFSTQDNVLSIQVFEDGDVDFCSPIKLPIARKYDCIEVEVSGGTLDKNNIGCPAA